MIGWTSIVISAEAYDGLRNHPQAGQRFVDDGQRMPDGSYKIRIQRVVKARLEKSRQSGETLSDVIVRLLAFARSKAH